MNSKNYLTIYAKSFNWSGFFLPKKIYFKCSVLYDFCRTIDNIADQNADLEIKKKELKEFQIKFEKKVLSDDISYYLHRPSATDPNMAPDGQDAFYVLVPVPNNLSKINWSN